MSISISPADTAPTDSSFEYWFDGDLLHGPEHGSLRDGFLEFYPRTHAAQGHNMQMEWISGGSNNQSHDPVWPPEDDPLDYPPVGKRLLIWHDGFYEFPENNDFELFYYDSGYPVERYGVTSPYQSFGAFRSYQEMPITGPRMLNRQSLVFWDLSTLPRNQVVTKAELIGGASTLGSEQIVHVTWITQQDNGPHGYPGWFADYAHRSGNAFRGSTAEFQSGFSGGALNLRGVNRIRPTNKIGLHIGFAPQPLPVFDVNYSANTSMDWGQWVSNWNWYREFQDSWDAEGALSFMPGLRIHFAPDDEPDEPLTRHDARQVRARHSTPRQVGRMKT